MAGSVGIVANYALFSQYTPVSLDLLLRHVSSVVQPVAALKSLLPALFGFLGGTLLLLVWNYLKVRVVRFLLDYNGWFLTPKSPLNKVKTHSTYLFILHGSLPNLAVVVYVDGSSCWYKKPRGGAVPGLSALLARASS